MAAVPFDTLKLATKLEEAGFTRDQARGAATAFTEALAEADLVTRGHFDARFDAFEAKQRAELLALEQRVTIRMGGMLAATIAIILAVLKLT